jgi:hypothetical protein
MIAFTAIEPILAGRPGIWNKNDTLTFGFREFGLTISVCEYTGKGDDFSTHWVLVLTPRGMGWIQVQLLKELADDIVEVMEE